MGTLILTTEKVERGTAGRNGGATKAPHTSLLAALLGRRIGKTDKGAQGDIDRVRSTLAHIAALVSADPSIAAAAAELVAAVNVATAVHATPTLCPTVILEAQTADLAEDAAEAAYHANPCRDTLLVWRSAQSKALASGKRLLAAMGEELAK